jgi:hypothetical protein
LPWVTWIVGKEGTTAILTLCRKKGSGNFKKLLKMSDFTNIMNPGRAKYSTF